MTLNTQKKSLLRHVNPYRFESVTRSLRAMRDGMLWLVPCLIVSSILGFIASMLEFMNVDAPVVIHELNLLRLSLTSLYPYLFAASISMMLAIKWRLPRPPIAVLCIAYVAVAEKVLGYGGQITSVLLTFVGLTIPLYAVPLLSKIKRQRWARLLENEVAGRLVKDSMNLIIPGVIVTLVVVLVTKMVKFAGVYLDSPTFLTMYNPAGDPYCVGAIFSILNSSLWFLGIHGYYALTPLVEPLMEMVEINHLVFESGGIPSNIMNMSTMSSFIFIGGSGATLGLSLAILLISKDKLTRVIAITSIPLGLFNINEILLFGLPIIFNLRLFFPFLLAPLLNMAIALMVLQLGWVATPVVMTPITSPLVINALVATGGDVGAVVLQAGLVLLSTLVYLPFVRLLDTHAKTRDLYIPSLDTTFTRREEEAYILTVDPVTESLQKVREIQGMQSQLEEFATREFYLEYQPQVSSYTGQVVGVEALIRLRDNAGNVEGPGQFLSVFEQANLMTDIDLWVVRQSVIQSQKWMDLTFYMPISVNISSHTLTDKVALEEILKQISKVPGLIHFEITEESLIDNQAMVEESISRLHQAGSTVHIDDFGTGYSSLSYLNRFDIDTLKIDRSFVMALDSERGKQVFYSLTGIAKQLGMNIVVEGVETKEQFEIVSREPDVVVQGWYFSRSVSAEEVRRYSVQRAAVCNTSSLDVEETA
ncbi:EAL domain-containing protein [Enterovibrio paralichthyis]|uniref:EAL domain-containing protein n=1 Tax=Enterovibrio paralichthyis TaxID=2853805 RepID=UPI001C48AE29|nr:EAL domain-containing protein [Enterovibrio paralichthyis]MBV7296428.1 EAL domain-containing protein [Enterovibrio paralichthyis]